MAWLMLGVVYCAGRWLFNARAGLLSAACLLGSYYFARHSRLAETDIPATLFVTLAVYALWRAKDDRWIAWMHLAGFAIGMSILCKGGPGAFPLIFLVAIAMVERSFTPIRRFFASGAFLTLAIVALPWFLFAGYHQGWHTFLSELRTVEAGTDHGAPIYQYIPWLIVGTLPWTIVTLIGVFAACREWTRDWRARGLLVWLGSIAIPLCITGNKQSHYLIPLMPVLMIFTGWMIDRWNRRWLSVAVVLTAIVVPLLVTLVLPIYIPQHTRETTQFVRDHFGDEPLCFYGPNASIPLCFNLRRQIPTADDEPELMQFIARDPRVIVITIGKDKRPATAPSAEQFEKIDTAKWEDQVWEFYRLVR
jgi:4-amino-4-deoxy-L-arabinose transferase-like glycosyltransferase